ncbi:MAG: hypothetical protein KAU21_15780, partial [Gammaproteobacteria bacterium]|nr:hypothetical protein [Gammaproteobacteria bacterium]
RKFSLLLKLSPMLDLQVGRQVLTWGTGDLLFLNDLFPKDWHYWLGRDIEYIKAPSDAVKLSWFNPAVNFDLVYTPRFDSDRYITGERLSFWNDLLGRHSGRDDIILVDKPDDLFSDDEWSFRLYRNIGSMELALYGYDGYFKSPAGIDTTTGKFTFPAMRSLGASLRTPAGPGILNLETANWRSKDDTSGTDPFINNSETRFLMGYEWEAMKNFTVAVQYYVSKMDEYNNYIDNLPAGILKRPELHEVYTLRLTKFMINQNLKLTWFSYYSPENNDVYIRPEANYQINDQWTVEVGAEWMDVDDDEPNGFFGQFKNNSNVFVAVRYNFAGDI